MKMRDFQKRTKAIAEGVAKNTDGLMRATILAVDSAVVQATPVLSGRARANWRVKIGSMDGTVLPTPSSPAAGAAEAANSANQAAQGYSSTVHSGTPVHISNSLVYVPKLNEGSSKQAPAQFVRTAALNAAEIVSRVKLIE